MKMAPPPSPLAAAGPVGRAQNATCPAPVQRNRLLKLKNWADGSEAIDILHLNSGAKSMCTQKVCEASLMNTAIPTSSPRNEIRSKEEILADAQRFIEEFYAAAKRADTEAHHQRWQAIQDEVEEKGYYDLTKSELVYGTKLAWRNALRCIGRIQWSKLQVFDCRQVTTPQGMYLAVLNHIKYGMNNGNIRSAITVFPPRIPGRQDSRMWNPQIVSFAGYKQPDGSVVGDPLNVEFTEVCQRLGWKGKGGRFDILPLVFSCDGHEPQVFEIPSDLISTVKLKHPQFEWFESLGLEWYTLPGVSSLLFDCGGMEFPATPFNGWYMVSEIACRDLCDSYRYNILETVGRHMGLDTSTPTNYWKDKALVEVNVAVMHSFQEAGVTIVDHHTAAESFMKHLENENRVRRGCPSDWVWIVPPISGSLTPVYHQEMALYYIKPSYEYQTPAWKLHKWKDGDLSESGGAAKSFKQVAWAALFTSYLFVQALKVRITATILFATETGKSEKLAKILGNLFSHAFNVRVFRMDEYDIMDLESESLVLVVTSTFGNGDPPECGESFAKQLHGMKVKGSLTAEEEFRRVNTNTLIRAASQEVSNTRHLTGLVRQKSRIADDADVSIMTENIHGILTNVKFAVFGLGSSAYPNVAAFGKYVDAYFDELGAERLCTVGLGDELRGQEQSFNLWAKNVYKAACADFCIDDPASLAAVKAFDIGTEDQVDESKLRLQLVKAEEDICQGLMAQHPARKIFPCEVQMVKRLYEVTSEDYGTLQVCLGTALGENHGLEIDFEPGDHLGLFPKNREDIVEEIIRRLADAPDPDKPVQLEIFQKERTAVGLNKGEWKPVKDLAQASLKTILYRYRDVTTPPSPDLLLSFAKSAANEDEKNRLELLANDQEEYEQWRAWKYPHLLEVLEEFSSVTPSAALLVHLLPAMQPRFYSISSSRAVHPKQVHVTVGVVTYHAQGGNGPKHHGVCSTYLRDVKDGELIPAFIRHAPTFRMPPDPKSPIIMVGPGTGVAPFRSFWQQRKADVQEAIDKTEGMSNFGPTTLFVGCRFKEWNLYADETQALVESGVLTRRLVALSREPGTPKTYVQHLMRKNGKEIYQQLTSEGGHFYVCGDCVMAEEVYVTLREIIQQLSGVNSCEAEKRLVQMKEEHRYHEDIFGITLNIPTITGRKRNRH